MNNSMYVIKASAGTGKTFTLAAHYIALLMSGVGYKHIMAVTFTNKATAEMKERIIGYLQEIATAPSSPTTQGFLIKVREVSKLRGIACLEDEAYQQKAAQLVRDILADFDNMRITTIDTFLQSLMSGLASALKLMAGYSIELDLDHTIREAVDQLLTATVADDDEVRKAVVRCLNERLNSEDKWDLRDTLVEIVKEVYNENVLIHKDELLLCGKEHTDYVDVLSAYRKQLRDEQKAEIANLSSLFETILPYRQALSEGTGAKNYNAFFARIEEICKTGNGSFKGLGSADLNRFDTPQKLPNVTNHSEIKQTIERISELLQTVEKKCVRATIRTKYLDDLMLVGYVVDQINKNLLDNNTILLAETAYKLVRALKAHDAAFILLKAGIRYQHIMLDEFQDTSTLQWQNFKSLILEILASGGTALIVGDTKQSIYRWRGGDYEIMNTLQSDQELKHFYSDNALSRNFRSRREIVGFNMQTFQSLTQSCEDEELRSMYDEDYSPERLAQYYKAGKEGGYVRFRKYDYEKSVITNGLRDMFAEIEELLSKNYRKKDILILVLRNAEGEKIIEAFNEIIQEEAFPRLREAGKIVSKESYHLDSSLAVLTIIAGLKYITLQDGVSEHYIRCNHSHSERDCIAQLNQINKHLPLMDLIEQITRICLCDEQGGYHGTDIAYLNCFKDNVRNYIGSYGSDVVAFLQQWDDTMHKKNIPDADTDDIQIMTIHSAKGLQAKNVFIPFCDWLLNKKKGKLWCKTDDVDSNADRRYRMPVDYSDNMKIAGYEADYAEEQRKKQIDALNTLYVAFTRAEDNLYIHYNLPYKNGGQTVGGLLQSLYGDEREWGERVVPEIEEHQEEDKQLEFTHAPLLQTPLDYTYRSVDARVVFKQSMQARELLYGRDAQLDNTDAEQLENIAFGNLCHAILEKISTKQDVERVIDAFDVRGQILSAAQKKNIHQIINHLMEHPVAGEWFSGGWTLLKEDTVLCVDPRANSIIQRRMDRVMIRGNEAVVLDYKFGTPKPEYETQVKAYMDIMRAMGYASVSGYLWYGFTNKLVEIC